MQNGIANDDMALRLFPHVYGVMIEMPVTYATPGEVVAYYSPKPGLVHIAGTARETTRRAKASRPSSKKRGSPPSCSPT